MIGAISRAWEAGRQDRRAGIGPKTRAQRGESQKLHRFYLDAWESFRWTAKDGFPQLELPGIFGAVTASQDAPGTRLDTSRDC